MRRCPRHSVAVRTRVRGAGLPVPRISSCFPWYDHGTAVALGEIIERNDAPTKGNDTMTTNENVDTLPADGAVVVSCTGPGTHRFGVVLSRETTRWGTHVMVSWSDGTQDSVSYCVGHIESGHPHAAQGIGVYTLGPAAVAKAATLMVRQMHALANDA